MSPAELALAGQCRAAGGTGPRVSGSGRGLCRAGPGESREAAVVLCSAGCRDCHHPVISAMTMLARPEDLVKDACDRCSVTAHPGLSDKDFWVRRVRSLS